jgi:glycosyltransferase involved in cell wall biosynthesis
METGRNEALFMRPEKTRSSPSVERIDQQRVDAIPNALFLGSMYAGHRTRFLNLQARARSHPALTSDFRAVTGWREGGALERFPLLPKGVRGRVRATLEASAIARLPRPDVIWTSCWEVATPYVVGLRGPFRKPIVVDLDRTYEQLNAMSLNYFKKRPKRGPSLTTSLALEKVLWRATTVFTPWSNWAAEGLRRGGVDDARIMVNPPGVDLDAWRPGRKPGFDDARPVRLLFVGGDFERKGGDMLVDVFRERLVGRCELDIVTHASARRSSSVPGLRFHSAEPNSDVLRRLYERADLFVLPTRADCFGIAAVEAMASGLPVIMGNVGGAADIVSPGENGWLIQPKEGELSEVLEAALARPEHLAAMGSSARRRAEERFDGRQNDERIIELMVELGAQSRRQRGVA